MNKPQLELFELDNPPLWGRSADGQNIYAGGFSGLIYLGNNEFMTHTDRGPNAEPVGNVRPFLVPDFKPRWIKIKADVVTKKLMILEEIVLTDPLGNPLSGLPQLHLEDSKLSDEIGVDGKGKRLSPVLMGFDLEGLTRDAEGNFWMGDEYRPSILKFNGQGQLLKVFIPKNSMPSEKLKEIQKKYGKKFISESLPEAYRFRKPNRGFEGITFYKEKIYALVQSSLEPEDLEHKRAVRLLAFDVKSESVSEEYIYPFKIKDVEKIGDLAVKASGEFIAIEQNESIHHLNSFFLETPLNIAHPEKENLDSLTHHFLNVRHLISLVDIGFDFAEKIEGLAIMSENQMAVVNDNDFGLGSIGTKKTYLGVITFPK